MATLQTAEKSMWTGRVLAPRAAVFNERYDDTWPSGQKGLSGGMKVMPPPLADPPARISNACLAWTATGRLPPLPQQLQVFAGCQPQFDNNIRRETEWGHEGGRYSQG